MSEIHPSVYEPEFSFQSMFLSWYNFIISLIKSWKQWLPLACMGAIIGCGFAWYKPVTYTARLSFVVEEGKSGGGSLVSALAGQFGFDLGSLSGTSGVLAGDNVQELLKSRSLIRKTLLTPYDPSSNISLADQYALVYGWKKKWEQSSYIQKPVQFPIEGKLNRQQDSLLQLIIKNIVDKEFSVAKPDKKLGFFEATATFRDEMLAKLFIEKLMQVTTDFYITTKTKRLQGNVNRLQQRADSIGALLNKKTYSSIAETQLLLDVNPAYMTSSVGAEITSRDKMMLATIYAELVKNLELSKTALIQETPTIQIVDAPIFPLKKNRLGYLKAIALGIFAGFVLAGIRKGIVN